MGFPLNSPSSPETSTEADPANSTEKQSLARPAWREIYDSIIAGVSQYEGIDSSQARIDLRFLVRQNARCALDISVLGPRRMKPHAIWSWVDGKIFYYDSGGKRWKDEDVDPSIQPPADLTLHPVSA